MTRVKIVEQWYMGWGPFISPVPSCTLFHVAYSGFSARNASLFETPIACSFSRSGPGYPCNSAGDGGGGAGRGRKGDGNLSPPHNSSDAQNSSGGGGSSNIPPAVRSRRQGVFSFNSKYFFKVSFGMSRQLWCYHSSAWV